VEGVHEIYPAFQASRSRQQPDGSRIITVVLDRNYRDLRNLEGRRIWIDGELCRCEQVCEDDAISHRKGERIKLKVSNCPEDSMAPFEPSRGHG
jgi:hypothetical protein